MRAMMNRVRWEHLGKTLHRLSYLKVGFYLLGLYYQFHVFFGSRADFVHNQCSSLLMYGLGMLLEALRDNELTAEHFVKKNTDLGRLQWVVAIAAGAFLLAVLQGLVFLYYLHDKFQGEAIVTFGIGGLAVMRLQYDCLNHALSLRERAETASSIPVEVSPEGVREVGEPQESTVRTGSAS
jgi:hypothetical protein